jgi:type I restriction enzyme S subunit
MSEEATLDEFIQSKEESKGVNGEGAVSVGDLQQLENSPIESWDLVKLGYILSLEYGDNLPSDSRENGEIPVYGSNGQVDTHSEPAVDEPGIILGRKGSIGEIEFSDEPFWPIDTTYYITAEETDQNLRFLYYLLQNIQLERLNAASAIPGLNRNDTYGLNALVPPLEQQCKIASVLYNVDQAIQKTEEIIEQTERVLNGTLNEIFTRGLDQSGSLRPSPDTSPEDYREVGRYFVPTGWDVNSLQELCTENITYGIVQPGPHVEDGIPYVNTEDMTDGSIPTEGLSRTSQEIAEKYSRSEIHTGELVVTIRATIGAVDQVPPELDGANLTRGTARVVPGESVNNRFLLWAIRSNTIQFELDARVKGTTFDEINLDQLGKIPIPYPADMDEQARIVEVFSSIEDRIENEESYLDVLKRLKQGLMQDLLSGTVRTTNTNIEVPDEIAQHG